MFGDIIVPLDGSDRSAVALGPAGAMARFLGSKVRMVGLAPLGEQDDVRSWMGSKVRMLGDVPREFVIMEPGGGVAGELEQLVSSSPGDLVCMTTHGRGRNEAIFGSVAGEVVRHISGPVMLVGPNYSEHRFRCGGELLVSVDGSRLSETILPVVEAFAIVFHFEVTVVTVVDPKSALAAEAAGVEVAVESAYVHRLADKAAAAIGRPVSFEVLHGDPAAALVSHAESLGCALVAMATHGKSGLRRLTAGSVTADVVRRSTCPVLAVRPPDLVP